jgi:hypothetical protein
MKARGRATVRARTTLASGVRLFFLVILAHAGIHLLAEGPARTGDGFLPPDQVEGRLRRNDGAWDGFLSAQE